jgi:serine/threonine protein kinase
VKSEPDPQYEDHELEETIRNAKRDFSIEAGFQSGLKLSRELGRDSSNLLPTAFGKYQLLEALQLSESTSVYIASHDDTDHRVALKMLTARARDDLRLWARFDREIEIIKKLDHPNVVKMLDSGSVENVPYFTMELLDGYDLSKLVKRTGPPPVADCVEIVRQAAIGLGYVSKKGLVHRDIKPSNLFLTSNGTIKLLDLGIASECTQQEEVSLTSSNQLLGTIDYMAPEQVFDSHGSDVRSDIYSLGFTFFQLLAGFPPYYGSECQNVFRKAVAHSTQEIPSIRDYRTDVSRKLESVLFKMCKKNPNQRFQTAEAVANALVNYCNGNQLKRLLDIAKTTTELREHPSITMASRPPNRKTLRPRNVTLSMAVVSVSIAVVSVPILAVLQKPKTSRLPSNQSETIDQRVRIEIPLPGTYSGQNRNSSNRVDPAYTILSEDLFCYGQQPPSRKIGGTWVRDRSHAIERLGYYVYRQWPSAGSIVVIVSYDGERYQASYFNGPSLESPDLLKDSSLAESYGEFSGKWVSEDCYVDGTYDRGFKSDVHETWQTTLREFAPTMLVPTKASEVGTQTNEKPRLSGSN